MPHRREHQEEVRHYLQRHFRIQNWGFSLPRGSGVETYFIRGNGRDHFVKVGAAVERYLAMAEIGLTPPILTYGELESGLPVVVQPVMEGRRPSQRDFCDQMDRVALLIHKMHHHSRAEEIVQAASSNRFKDAGLQALDRLHFKWAQYKERVPTLADFVDSSLEHLARQTDLLKAEGLIVSHGDICNANWLFTSDGRIYILDFESMSMDDPAADMGALLWWYYPPELRQQFLNLAGYSYDDEFRFRMRFRMAMHCLSITLPREGSFDSFDPEGFSKSLRDFRAVLDGKENPEGYSR